MPPASFCLSSNLPCPLTSAWTALQELLTEQALVDLLLDIIPRGEAAARKFGAAEHQQLEVALYMLLLY